MLPISEETLGQLQTLADQVAENAYAPYSNFRVGAALLLSNGATVSGCNVENASYGLTSCAERNALFRAIAEHGPGLKIAALAVTNRKHAPSPPCGACRQVLAEFALPATVVSFRSENGFETRLLAELLPFSFHFGPTA